MHFTKQKFRHDPENGVYGDCFRTALACILDLPCDDVPHFMEDNNPDFDVLWERVDEWLHERNLRLFKVAFDCELQELLDMMGRLNGDIYYFLSGKSKTGVIHTVICYGGQIIHDPSRDNSGIIAPCDEDNVYWVDILTSYYQRISKLDTR